MEKPQQPGNSGFFYYIQVNREVGLLHTAKKGGIVIAYTLTSRDYYIQQNKEVSFTNIHSQRLHRVQPSGHKHLEDKVIVDIACTNCQ